MVFKKGDFIMNIKEILADIRSDRVKRVILDTDAYNEMDDQYAIAYCMASSKINLIGINAALFNNYNCNGFADGMEKSYYEIIKVLDVMGKTGDVPVFKGNSEPLNEDAEGAPEASEAALNIIREAHASDETLYVLSIGAITNVASALMLDPSIKEKLCVVWLGGNDPAMDPAAEFNYAQDPFAGRYVLNSGVNYVLLPALSEDKTRGTQALYGKEPEIKMITGDSPASVFFRETLPERYGLGKDEDWWHIFWDIAAPALLDTPEFFDLEIITAPRIRGDGVWAFEEGRHEIIYMNKLCPEEIFKKCFAAVSSF